MEMVNNGHKKQSNAIGSGNFTAPGAVHGTTVALLTGGGDKPYAFGLATALTSKGATFDLIGSDELDFPEFRNQPGVHFLNLRGDQRPNASFPRKVLRISTYYVRLIRYAAAAKPKLFHILWNNKFEFFDRTLLMAYYRYLGKTTVLTLHNVNAGRRNSADTPFNRLTLRIQYRLADHIFVHTERMKLELIAEYGVPESRVTVIPFGINNAVPNTSLTSIEAKRRLGVERGKKAILFFGNLAPYKGIEYLIAAFRQLLAGNGEYQLIIAGSPHVYERYWRPIREAIREDVQMGRVLLKDEFIPDEDTEVYFKAADVLVLPYRHIYQSGVLFLGHSFGLPVVAADVGCLKEEIVEGQTGFVFRPEDTHDLARVIETYFESDLYANLECMRPRIRDYATTRHSWDAVSQITMSVYASLAGTPESGKSSNSGMSNASLEVKPLHEEASVSPGRM
jgi:glycosyltransferase involved in cell wall biosynthesis